jgi:hypothetical protein
MRVLLDTCVISELHRDGGDATVREALLRHQPNEVFLSVVTMGEITKGLMRLPDGPKRQRLADWLRGLDQKFQGRILPVDRETATVWGELLARGESNGRVVPVADGLIAATAIQYGLRVYTRNVADFEGTGAMVVNPWSFAG